MKFRFFPLMTLLMGFAIFFTSCIDNQATEEILFQKDLEAIQEYLDANPITSVKAINDEYTGIRIFWQEVSNSGIKIVDGDTARVNYTGKLLTNRVFDTSIESVAKANNIFSENRNYIPLKFRLGNRSLIPGFEYGVAQMEQGDKITIIMPSLYGYGSSAAGDIPANSPLIFELDLIQVIDGPTQ
ncbi:FKBP-type peptidyl-prolyl cis-trans isomerase [Algoriphagus sp. CAU 1675]|uniref:FKBP-type peptidyl-prolyl cis-trans isomerase n=1 Tax=Algoriphagus sp. CAU 1675 TaxID=3032597 RepID=UPI0023DCDDBA|nr:FKBP-type peptidyl-prolyl cis-trans isomerase [Algoriphagus sp. CAU 1675]MDF2156554.1 FKBP-type peptidyl-prolyl cis-trans isomerase [Algoriphagus sp. CAU 1675]